MLQLTHKNTLLSLTFNEEKFELFQKYTIMIIIMVTEYKKWDTLSLNLTNFILNYIYYYRHTVILYFEHTWTWLSALSDFLQIVSSTWILQCFFFLRKPVNRKTHAKQTCNWLFLSSSSGSVQWWWFTCGLKVVKLVNQRLSQDFNWN